MDDLKLSSLSHFPSPSPTGVRHRILFQISFQYLVLHNFPASPVSGPGQWQFLSYTVALYSFILISAVTYMLVPLSASTMGIPVTIFAFYPHFQKERHSEKEVLKRKPAATSHFPLYPCLSSRRVETFTSFEGPPGCLVSHMYLTKLSDK